MAQPAPPGAVRPASSEASVGAQGALCATIPRPAAPAPGELIAASEVLPCPQCGSLAWWQGGDDAWHCERCEPPTATQRWLGHKLRIETRSDVAFADSPDAAPALAVGLRYFEGLVGDVTAARTGRTVLRWPCPLPTPCRRCGCLEAAAVVIHEGESIRRDCARCGAFRDFAIWRDRAEVDAWLRSPAEAGTIEASRPGAENTGATLTETP